MHLWVGLWRCSIRCAYLSWKRRFFSLTGARQLPCGWRVSHTCTPLCICHTTFSSACGSLAFSLLNRHKVTYVCLQKMRHNAEMLRCRCRRRSSLKEGGKNRSGSQSLTHINWVVGRRWVAVRKRERDSKAGAERSLKVSGGEAAATLLVQRLADSARRLFGAVVAKNSAITGEGAKANRSGDCSETNGNRVFPIIRIV